MKKFIWLLLFLVGSIFSAHAQFNTIFNFTDSLSGSRPTGSLISDGTFLYGMTPWGGINDSGVVFKVLPDGTGYLKLLDFVGVNGARPNGDLFYDGTFLYGMTSKGGVNDSGVIFKIMPDGTGYLKLLDFNGIATGNSPFGGFVSDGTYLYGMTYFGGTNNFGTVFKIKTDGTGFLKLLDFTGTNGKNPSGSLISDGTFLYGMTNAGGANNKGVVFKIKTDGTAYSDVLDCSVVTGGNPLGSLITDGTYLYGMTQFLGSVYNYGTIFKIKTDGTGFFKLLDFNDVANGSYPAGSLVSDGTFLYGLTFGGGSHSVGAIFKISPAGTNFSKLFDFAVDTNGYRPEASLFFDGTFFYGMTYLGGTCTNCPFGNCGTIFKFQESPAAIVESSSQNAVSVFPNPSNGIFTVNSKSSKGEISIVDLLGNNVYNSQFTNTITAVDLSGQANGIYFLTIRYGNEVSTQKITVSH